MENPIAGGRSRIATPRTAGPLSYGRQVGDHNPIRAQFEADLRLHRSSHTALPGDYDRDAYEQIRTRERTDAGDTTAMYAATGREPNQLSYGQRLYAVEMRGDYKAHDSPSAPGTRSIPANHARWAHDNAPYTPWHQSFSTQVRNHESMRIYGGSAYQMTPAGARVPRRFSVPNPMTRVREYAPDSYDYEDNSSGGLDGTGAYLALPGEMRRSR